MGTYIDNGRLVTIRNASDHSAWVGLSTPNYDMTGKRWEGLHSRPHSYSRTHVEDGDYHWLYLSDSIVVGASFERCVLYNVLLGGCTLRNCHVHFSGIADVEACMFIDCVLTTDAGAFTPKMFNKQHTGDVGSSVVFTRGVLLQNCTLKGNFTMETGGSDIITTAKNVQRTQLAPYEVYNNIVFKDCVVDCLRRWIWRHRLRTTTEKQSHKSKFFPLPKALKGKGKAKSLPKWSSKAAGKRPLILNDAYDTGEQLDLPARRFEWSVDRKRVALASPPRKRKVDLTWMNLD